MPFLPHPFVFFVLAGVATLLGIALICEKRAWDKEEGVVLLLDRALYDKGKAAFLARSSTPSRFDKGVVGRYIREAGLEVRVDFAVCFVVGSTAFVSAVLVVAGAGALGAGAAVVFMPCAAVYGVRKMASKRKAALDAQFSRLVPRLAASVRGSMTLERAFRTAAASVEEPLRGELTRMLADSAYGMPLDQALEGMARRTGHADMRALAAAVRIQQKRGGNIAEALDMIAGRMTTRMKTAHEISSELAGTKMAKWVVAAAMPVLFFVMFIANTSFSRFYQQEPAGWILIIGAVTCEMVGLAASQRITSMEGAVDSHGQ